MAQYQDRAAKCLYEHNYFAERRSDVQSVILCGIETHACIHHTTLELMEQGNKSLKLYTKLAQLYVLKICLAVVLQLQCNSLLIGLDVHVVVDCCSSRSMSDRRFALERLRDVGAFLTTSECVILGLAPDAAHPKFKQIQKLVMHSAADTGLV